MTVQDELWGFFIRQIHSTRHTHSKSQRSPVLRIGLEGGLAVTADRDVVSDMSE